MAKIDSEKSPAAEPSPAPAPALDSGAGPAPGPVLTGKQRRHLRALGHHLNAVVQVGHDGITPALIAQTRLQLEVHELIKVKVSDTAPDSRQDAAEALARATSSALAQVLGRTFLIYRPRKQKPEIKLP